MSLASSNKILPSFIISHKIFFSFSSSTACIPARYILSVLSSIGMAIIYGLKVNLSVAMVAMVNHTAIKSLASDSDNHGGHVTLTNITRNVEECEAELPKNGTSGDQVWIF